ncbi:MAG: ABC transporter ATP-binding protein [Planctomycetes bacterium]|nr:ABC transporter ATP-binding protein [Planctomycetota bacterium]
MVVTENLSRNFSGFRAVDGLSITVEEGDCFGFIGPNGAGKTTTLRMLATILKPTGGRALVGGLNVSTNARKVRRLIGYMPDVFGVYEDMLVHEYLSFFSAAYGIVGKERLRAIEMVLDLTGLHEKRNAGCKALSRGMTQRLSLARVLLHDPKLLLLDEPASGLDPRARIEFKELVLALKKLGKTLIISSHILSELGEMCNSMAIIERSRLIYCGPVEGATRQVSAQGRIVKLMIQPDPEAGRTAADALELVRGLPFVEAVRQGDREKELAVRIKPEFADIWQLNHELVSRGYKVESMAEEVVRLEDVFLQLTKGVVQ